MHTITVNNKKYEVSNYNHYLKYNILFLLNGIKIDEAKSIFKDISSLKVDDTIYNVQAVDCVGEEDGSTQCVVYLK